MKSDLVSKVLSAGNFAHVFFTHKAGAVFQRV